jgi:NAD(P)-dependent dehydrogenase (short-subunit alcohol dehydrogenase family)
MISLQSRRTVITGAAAGIGLETARLFAQLGARVIIADVNAEGAKAAADRIMADGGWALPVAVNIADETAVTAMAERVKAELGGLDVLVNNAAATGGAGKDLDLIRTDLQQWDLACNVNLRGTMLVSRALLPVMLEAGGGAIINIASRKGLRPERNTHLAYSVSKAGLIMLSAHIAASYGKQGIRSNVVAPGSIRTEIYERQKPEALKAQTISRVLTQDIGEPADIARAIAYLASDAGRYITGQIWSIDGGVLAYLDG